MSLGALSGAGSRPSPSCDSAEHRFSRAAEAGKPAAAVGPGSSIDRGGYSRRSRCSGARPTSCASARRVSCACWAARAGRCSAACGCGAAGSSPAGRRTCAAQPIARSSCLRHSARPCRSLRRGAAALCGCTRRCAGPGRRPLRSSPPSRVPSSASGACAARVSSGCRAVRKEVSAGLRGRPARRARCPPRQPRCSAPSRPACPALCCCAAPASVCDPMRLFGANLCDQYLSEVWV